MVLFNSQRQVTMETMLTIISDKYIKLLTVFCYEGNLFTHLSLQRESDNRRKNCWDIVNKWVNFGEQINTKCQRSALRESVSTNWLAYCSLISRRVLSYVIVSAYRLYIFVFASHKLFHCPISFTFQFSVEDACKDHLPHCSKWTKEGLCTDDWAKNYVNKFCPLSCK